MLFSLPTNAEFVLISQKKVCLIEINASEYRAHLFVNIHDNQESVEVSACVCHRVSDPIF